MSELADQLQALLPEIDAFFDANSDDRLAIPFHGCGFMSTNTAQTNLLGEFLLHGQDVAQAVKLPWDLPERDMALILRGAREMVPIYLRLGWAPTSIFVWPSRSPRRARISSIFTTEPPRCANAGLRTAPTRCCGHPRRP